MTQCDGFVILFGDAADEHAWQNNDEFAREFLAGLNPVVIERVTVMSPIDLVTAFEFAIRSKAKCCLSSVGLKVQ